MVRVHLIVLCYSVFRVSQLACESCFALNYKYRLSFGSRTRKTASEVLNGIETHLRFMSESGSDQGRVAAVKQLIGAYVMVSVQIVVFFVSAGYISVRPWIFFGASFVHYSVSTLVQYRLIPWLW